MLDCLQGMRFSSCVIQWLCGYADMRLGDISVYLHLTNNTAELPKLNKLQRNI